MKRRTETPKARRLLVVFFVFSILSLMSISVTNVVYAAPPPPAGGAGFGSGNGPTAPGATGTANGQPNASAAPNPGATGGAGFGSGNGPTAPGATGTANGKPTYSQPATNVTIKKDNIQKLTNEIAFYAVLACIVGLIVSMSLWAMGSKGQNPGTELTGKRGVVLCLLAAFFIGAAPKMVGWMDEQTGVSSGNDAGITQ